MKKYRVVFGVASVVVILTLIGYLLVRDAANRSAALASEVEQSVERVSAAAETRDDLLVLALL